MARRMTIAEAFDEWQRQYERDPEAFGNDMVAHRDHKRGHKKGRASDYGEGCADLLRDLMKHGRKAWKLRRGGE